MVEHTPTQLMLDGRGYRPDTKNGGQFVPLLEVSNHGWIADVREPKANADRLVACWNAFVGEPGREIATDKIEPGLFWEVRDALAELQTQTGADGWYHLSDARGKAYYKAQALLAKLEPQK